MILVYKSWILIIESMDVVARYFELFDNLISKMPVTDDVNVWIGYLGMGVNLLFLIYYVIYVPDMDRII